MWQMTLRQPCIDAIIPMPPKAKGRPRFTRKTGHAYTPSETTKWAGSCAAILAQYTPSEPLTGPLVLDVMFVMPRPGYMRKRDRSGYLKHPEGLIWHIQKPDGDNCLKMIKDVATTVRWWTDDCVVSCGTLLKATAELDGEPRIEIMVSELCQTPEEIWQICKRARNTQAA